MKIAYISGPYRSGTVNGIYENIQKARAIALKYWRLGYAVICPHINTAFMDGENDSDMFLAGDIEILKRCDIIVMMPGWGKSEGAIEEYKEAVNCDLEIIEE